MPASLYTPAEQARKALTAALVAGGMALGVALADGGVTIPELYVSLGAAITGLVSVYKIPNGDDTTV